MSGPSDNDQRPDVFRSPVLERLASALGGTVDSLFGASDLASEHRDTRELLSLWFAIRTEPARARVLSCARAAVAAQGD